MNYPKITLITPSYNQGKFIETTIKSVIDQNYPNLEYIIIDGGSTDETVDVIKKYEEYISYWVSEPDGGQSEAINKGLEQAGGDIFYWLNSDDYLEPNSLHTVAKEFTENNINVLCVKSRFFDHETNKTIAISQVNSYKSVEKTICESGMAPAIFYRLDKISTLGRINENLHYAMDFDLWFKYLFEYGSEKIKLCNTQIIVHFRLHEASKSVASKNEFSKDTNAINYSILSTLDAPDYILNFYGNPEDNTSYSMDWNLSHINQKLLLAYYANQVSLQYYIKRDYLNCKKCLLFSLKNGYPLNRHFIIRFMKLVFIPKSLLNWIRNYLNQ